MNDNATPSEMLFQRVEDYSKTIIELGKLHAVDKSADMASSLVSRLAVFLIVALSVFIISIGIALWIGNVLHNSFYGFFIVGGFYALVALLLYTFRNQWIKYPVSNSIISQMLKQKAG
jgi:phosphoglycerol transferase MdoB-like AlkP superfamily enzyme